MKVAVADKVSASTRHADEMAVNSTYTAQVVAAQSTVAVHGTSAGGTSMQPETEAAQADASQVDAAATVTDEVFPAQAGAHDIAAQAVAQDVAAREDAQAAAQAAIVADGTALQPASDRISAQTALRL